MAPLSFAVSRKVNPKGAAPTLTQEQLWKGLQLKSRDPRGFLPGVASCEVTNKQSESKFTRTVSFEGNPPLVEEITEHDQAIIYFNADGVDRGVTNIVSYDEDNELVLTFCFAGGLPRADILLGKSAEEKNRVVGKAVEHTLQYIRELVTEGKI